MFKRLTRNALLAVLAIASALSMAALLAACSKGNLRDDVALSDLSAAFEAKIEDSEGLVEPGESYIAGSMKLDTAEFGDYIIKISSYSTNINEYGVFKAASTDAAKTLTATLEAYLDMRNAAWRPEYLPDQFPKLENAEVKQAGLYVMYAILGDAEREAVFSEFESMLKS